MCATDEYASIRLTSVCVTATTEPSTIVAMATTHSIGRQLDSRPGSAIPKMRRIAPNAATLVTVAIRAVTGVGAPW